MHGQSPNVAQVQGGMMHVRMRARTARQCTNVSYIFSTLRFLQGFAAVFMTCGQFLDNRRCNVRKCWLSLLRNRCHARSFARACVGRVGAFEMADPDDLGAIEFECARRKYAIVFELVASLHCILLETECSPCLSLPPHAQ